MTAEFEIRKAKFETARKPRQLRRIVCGVLFSSLSCALTLAQQPRGEFVEVDPIRCWWRTSHGAVSVGQPFSVVLTCTVLENDSVRVVPDESPLAVGTVQLAPFELLGGSHPADLRSGQRRFFQYDYTVRLIDPSAIGKNVTLPALAIHYRVESRLQAQALEGRDRTYLLPPEPVQIVAMVPTDAPDIRDGGDAPFGAIEATRFRARMFDIAALALAVLGVIVLIPAVIRGMGLARTATKTEAAGVSDRAVLARATSQLTEVQHEGRAGWTPDLVARALAAARIVAGYAIGRRPRQQAVAVGTDAVESRLAVTSGIVRRQRSYAASATTAADIARAVGLMPANVPAQRRALLERLQEALATLTHAQYGQEPESDSALDEAVRSARDAAQEVRREHRWMRVTMNGLGRRR
jgi:hypothetical protein